MYKYLSLQDIESLDVLDTLSDAELDEAVLISSGPTKSFYRSDEELELEIQELLQEVA